VPTLTPSPVPSATPSAGPTTKPTGNPSPTAKPTKAPQITIHIGFNHAQVDDPTFGNVAFYALGANDPNAEVVQTSVGAQVTFLNDDPSQSPHTGSGLGSTGFPGSFDNSSGFTQAGTVNARRSSRFRAPERTTSGAPSTTIRAACAT
jgi:hypothetical protein